MKKILTSSMLVILFLLFFIVTEAFSLTFYVDTSIGKDNSSCGEKPNKACKTISYAVQHANIIEAYEEVLINFFYLLQFKLLPCSWFIFMSHLWPINSNLIWVNR